MEIKQFVVVTDDPKFCLGTTLLYIDTRNTGLCVSTSLVTGIVFRWDMVPLQVLLVLYHFSTVSNKL